MSADVRAVGAWIDNAQLVADVARLGYLDGRVLDLSYGLGKFWTEHHPGDLTRNDLDPTKADHHHDAASPPREWWEAFDAVVWDGPYKLNGTPSLGEFDNRYGVDRRSSWQDRMSLLEGGVEGAMACARVGGYVLVKCQDQVVSGRKVWQARELTNVGEAAGGRLVDMFHLVTTPRPQPPGRPQVHARSNYSTLLVLRRTA